MVTTQSHMQLILFIRRTIDMLKNRDHLSNSYIEALLSTVLMTVSILFLVGTQALTAQKDS